MLKRLESKVSFADRQRRSKCASNIIVHLPIVVVGTMLELPYCAGGETEVMDCVLVVGAELGEINTVVLEDLRLCDETEELLID